ncbi:hypothetical protein [Aurantimonas sp. VKM B-3413]|uniref:hypothetical protein n=1 Tax=Aurantimonas sp. VKM B-3413 TaxID=2779401 RepID=UPI001E517FF9|nr:hypothetical protein [Aurantimonas sp. VKM B-3413]MCB8836557.1 hypothetical protein [Aurantimonas sp. VKM B-3413]
MDYQDLVAAISEARAETSIWIEGRKAFRRRGAQAINPYGLRSLEYQLWQEGFGYERHRISDISPLN